MAELSDFKKVVEDFAGVADFVTVYITEAHAMDQWNFRGNKYKIKQHASLQERVLAASILQEDDEFRIPGTFYVDKMDNEANLAYGALPERLYIVLDGTVAYEGRKGPHGYEVGEVRDWLHEFKNKSQ